jgi:hypothetical protein
LSAAADTAGFFSAVLAQPNKKAPAATTTAIRV